MTLLPTKRPRPGSIDWAAQEILRILDREEKEAEELRRLQREGWHPPHASRPEGGEDHPVFGDGRDVLVDLIQSRIDRRRALLNEARRRIDERQDSNPQAPRPIEERSDPSVTGDASRARGIGGLLDDWEPEPSGGIHAVARQEPLSGPYSDPRFQHVKYQPPLFGPGGAPNMGGAIIPSIHGAGVLGLVAGASLRL